MRNTKDKKNDAQKPKEDQLKVAFEDILNPAVEEYKELVARSFPRKINDEEL
jgi:hypothetical protein